MVGESAGAVSMDRILRAEGYDRVVDPLRSFRAGTYEVRRYAPVCRGTSDHEGTADIAQISAYDELKLRIERAPGGGHRVLAMTPEGEATGTFTLPFSDVEIENFVLRVGRPRSTRRGDTSSYGAAEVFGGRLFEALFAGPVRDLYRSSLARSRAQGHGLRVTLQLSGAPELMDVPWEYLYDDPSFLAVSKFTPVVRYLDLPRAYRPLELTPPMRILAMVSSPNDYAQLDVEKERTNLEQALGALVAVGAVEIEWLERPTLSSLLRRLQESTFHALHYVGHGRFDEQAGVGQLIFQDEGGWARPVTGEQLGTILQDFMQLRLAVLNACEGARTSRTDPFAGVAASLVERDIPAVIAMQFEITDVAAVTFAEGFYRGLASGAPVDAALAAARLGIFAERSDDIEFGTPVLFMRVGDGQVFDVPTPTVAPPAAVQALAPGAPDADPAPLAQPPAGPGLAREPVPPEVARVDVPEPEAATRGSAPRRRPRAPAARGRLRARAVADEYADAPASGGRRRAPAAAVAAVLLVVLGAGALLLTRGGDDPPAYPKAIGRPGHAGPMTLVVTSAKRIGSGVRVTFRVKSKAGAALYNKRIIAYDEHGDTYTPTTDGGQLGVPASGRYVRGAVDLQGPPSRLFAFGWSQIFWESQQPEERIVADRIPITK